MRSTAAPEGQYRAYRWFRERVLSRIYTYIFILSCVMHWRGGWGIFDVVIATIVPNDLDPHRWSTIESSLVAVVLLETSWLVNSVLPFSLDSFKIYKWIKIKHKLDLKTTITRYKLNWYLFSSYILTIV